MGYYTNYNGAKLAILNAYGIWFEIRKRGDTWEAHRRARASLHLNDWPLDGLDLTAIEGIPPPNITRVFGQTTRQRSPSPTPSNTGAAGDDPGRPTNPISLQTERGRGGRCPHGTGDDPFTLADLDDDAPTKGNGRLEGIPPTTFDGDRSRTINFLTKFKSFMLMNDDARIAKNPIKRCSYFLSLVKGPNVKGWTKRQLDWLDIVCEDPTELPWHMTAWQVLEREFRNAFVDYAEHKRAQDEIRKLKMNAGNVDQYIAEFQQLADRGNLDVNEPSNLRLFARGLPTRLAETCIDLVKP
jgi:hypothetical protein